MKTTAFKSGLQSELKGIGSNYIIESVEDIDNHTCIKFTKPVSETLTTWLNERFLNGVSTTTTDGSLVILNSPDEKATA